MILLLEVVFFFYYDVSLKRMHQYILYNIYLSYKPYTEQSEEDISSIFSI